MNNSGLDDVWFRHMGAVSAHLGFLELGGHSLKAVRLAADLQREAGVVVPVATILRDNPSLTDIKALAAKQETRTGPRGTKREARPARVQPMIASQRAIWADQQLKEDGSVYAVVGALALDTHVDDRILRAATAQLVERHDALRAHIEHFASGPALVFGRTSKSLEIRRFDVSTSLADAADVLAAAIDTTTAPLGRLGVLARQDGDILVAAFDHLVSDAEALDMFFADLATAYAAVQNETGTGGDRPALGGSSFASFLAQRRQHEHDQHEAALTYWRDTLNKVDLTRRLPFAVSGPASAGTCVVRRRLDASRTVLIEDGLRHRKTTIATALVSAVGGILGRASDQKQCLVGVPSSQRSTPESMNLVGMALGVLPVPVPSDGSPRERLVATRDALLEGQRFATVGLAEAVRAAGGDFDPANPPLAAWVNDLTSRQAPDGFGGSSSYIDRELARPLFPLSFYLHRNGDGLELAAFTDGQIFDDPGYLDCLADQVIAEIEALAHGASVAAAALPRPRPGRSFDATAVLDNARGAAAVHDHDGEWDCAHITAHATSVRQSWAAVDAGPGDVVLVRARRSAHLLPVLLGCWHAGLTTAIVDNHLPEVAIQQRADSIGARWQIETSIDTTPTFRGGCRRETETAAPGHVLFTSGTTGEPKPVPMDLAATLGSLHDYINTVGAGPYDRIGLTSGLGHDPMLRDLLVPHLTGAELHVPEAEAIRDPRKLAAFIVGRRLTLLHATPSLLELLLASDPDRFAAPDLKAIVCGGEPLTVSLLKRLKKALPATRLYNAYGCTESAQIASILDVTDIGHSGLDVPVSDRCGSTRVHIARGDALAAIGEAGEVVISGPYVTPGSNGYHRTGDRGRADTNGRIHLDGRLDRQLSLAGHRIAPETIEAVALTTPGVDQAWAGIDPTAPGMLTLAVTAAGDENPREELSLRLRSRLPVHEVPTRVLLVRDFELDAHHKRIGPGQVVADAPSTTTTNDVPELHRRVSEIIARTTGVSVTPRQNFFDAGLKSLQLLRVHRQLEDELALTLPPIALFEHPNVQALAHYIEAADAPAVALPRQRQRPRDRGAGRRSAQRAGFYSDLKETHRG